MDILCKTETKLKFKHIKIIGANKTDNSDELSAATSLVSHHYHRVAIFLLVKKKSYF